MLSLAFLAAFFVRFVGGHPSARMAAVMLQDLPFVVILQYSMLAWWRVPRFSWSFVSVRDLPPIVFAMSAAAAILLGVRYGCGLFEYQIPWARSLMIPASVTVCDAALGVLGIFGVRSMRRLDEHRRRRRQCPPAAPTRAILIGAGGGGTMLLQELHERADLAIEPIVFVDDDPLKLGQLIEGMRVVGTTAELAAIAQRFDAKLALITIASADGGVLHRIVDRCRAAGLQTKIVPPIHEIVSDKVRISQLRDVAIEDLLGRAPVVVENSAAGAAVTGRVVLVTGAG
ncbi:MAG TPA: hypothetical protein VK348_13125, partial [Planctomycetota bacterium]|nr:hypothetical protein [Planctomycetota bacterium]